jgi:hypothetical protein
MQGFAGRIAKITNVFTIGYYRIDIDGGKWGWENWMFDPDYKANEPLSAEDAIRAMLDGETLYNEDGTIGYSWNGDSFNIVDKDNFDVYTFYRRPAKQKRAMTRWEVLDWTNSEASRGWVVRIDDKSEWVSPQCLGYGSNIKDYRRARLLPDLSGVDESTIQRFEIEVEG